MVDFGQRMLHTDAFSWYMESDIALRSTIVAVASLDRAPDWEHLRYRVDRMSRLVPRFRQRVVEPPARLGPPRWIVDADFDIDWHMRRLRVPNGGGWPAVLELARAMAMADFDRQRPLWEAVEVSGLPGHQVALITKMHHALSDGIGAIQLMAYFADLSPELPPLETMPKAPPPSASSSLAIAASTVRDDVEEVWRNAAHTAGMLRRPVSAATGFVTTIPSVARIVRPITQCASPVLVRRTATRRLATVDVPLDALKAAARANGGHLNDAFLAGITGGLRRYHERRRADVDELRVTMPVSIRKPDDPPGGNRITLLRFFVPVGLTDPAERIRRTAEIVRAWRQERGIAHTQGIALGLNFAPRSYIQSILRRVDFLASDVPGLNQPVYVAGARVLAYYPFGPTIGTAVNLTLMSYVDTCNIGVNIDSGAVPDPDELVTDLNAGFDEVLSLAPARAAGATA